MNRHKYLDAVPRSGLSLPEAELLLELRLKAVELLTSDLFCLGRSFYPEKRFW